MIDLAVRHYVIDFCINILFDKFNSNLMLSDNGLPKVGQFFTRISHVIDAEHYYGCYITDVEHRNNEQGAEYYIIYFTYQTSDGDDLQDWLEEMEEIERINSSYESGELSEDDIEYLEEVGIDIGEVEIDDDDEIELYQYEDQVGVNSYYYSFIP
jgi:hypothetical protein